MRFPKFLGLCGYAALLIGVALLVLWIGMAASDHSNSMWAGIAAACVLIVAAGALTVSRLILIRRPIDNRPEQDPLQPEVTPDEAAEYEAHYHGRDIRRDDHTDH
ncbi:hypothetical protein [Gordonia sp. CPCC 205333]|uniref:hypothetical protein n=1 Tax=Gordonia sp. CPCC 205333 TaxID=3140790 RepID=UPI003AF3C018